MGWGKEDTTHTHTIAHAQLCSFTFPACSFQIVVQNLHSLFTTTFSSIMLFLCSPLLTCTRALVKTLQTRNLSVTIAMAVSRFSLYHVSNMQTCVCASVKHRPKRNFNAVFANIMAFYKNGTELRAFLEQWRDGKGVDYLILRRECPKFGSDAVVSSDWQQLFKIESGTVRMPSAFSTPVPQTFPLSISLISVFVLHTSSWTRFSIWAIAFMHKKHLSTEKTFASVLS